MCILFDLMLLQATANDFSVMSGRFPREHLSAHQQNAIEMAFCWCTNNAPKLYAG